MEHLNGIFQTPRPVKCDCLWCPANAIQRKPPSLDAAVTPQTTYREQVGSVGASPKDKIDSVIIIPGLGPAEEMLVITYHEMYEEQEREAIQMEHKCICDIQMLMQVGCKCSGR